MARSYKDKIGFFPYNEPIQFYNGGIYPLDNFKEIEAEIFDEANKDGFYYPPNVHTVSQSHEVVDRKLVTKEKVVQNSKRPAHIFKMPPSHEIKIIKPVFGEEAKKWDGLFLTYLVAFHFGIRLQFFDWWFESRVPISIKRDFVTTHSTTENFIDRAYENWSNVCDDARQRITNLLFMQTKIRSYEWDWERFIISYMVFDGCYKYLNKYLGVKSSSHRGRLQAVIDYYGMQYNEDLVSRIVELRNDLFHESLWDGGQPCNSGSTFSCSATSNLSWLNARVIAALLGYKGKYIQSCWWSRSMSLF